MPILLLGLTSRRGEEQTLKGGGSRVVEIDGSFGTAAGGAGDAPDAEVENQNIPGWRDSGGEAGRIRQTGRALPVSFCFRGCRRGALAESAGSYIIFSQEKSDR